MVAALALMLGVGVAVRVDFSVRAELVSLAAACIAAGVAIAQRSVSPMRSLGAIAVASAAGIGLAGRSLDVEGVAIEPLIWVLTIAGIIAWVDNRAALSRFGTLAAAGTAIVLPFLDKGLDFRGLGVAIEMLAAITACFAFGTALVRIHSQDSTSRPIGPSGPSSLPTWLPAAAVWSVAGLTAIAASIAVGQGWSIVTSLAVASAMLADSVARSDNRDDQTFQVPDMRVILAGMVAVSFAAALAIAAIAAGEPFGWPVAGAASAGLACLIALGWNSVAETELSLARLRRSAEESRIDALTGLANRRGLEERLQEEIARAIRYGHPFSMLMIDLDDFKVVNDRFGHAAGDRALESVAAVIQESIRTIDIASRFGGEEFVVLLPETALSGAAVVAERIQSGVVAGPAPHPFTVSIGVAEWDSRAPSRETLLDRADMALYRAKRSGKNRVELFW
jgi:diguanylate cyclase (GGDEF)-like protein